MIYCLSKMFSMRASTALSTLIVIHIVVVVVHRYQTERVFRNVSLLVHVDSAPASCCADSSVSRDVTGACCFDYSADIGSEKSSLHSLGA